MKDFVRVRNHAGGRNSTEQTTESDYIIHVIDLARILRLKQGYRSGQKDDIERSPSQAGALSVTMDALVIKETRYLPSLLKTRLNEKVATSDQT